MEEKTPNPNKVKRLRKQLKESENRLQTDPLVNGKLKIMQSILKALDLQMEWLSAGQTAQLLITFRSALQGQENEKSQTGFMGPALLRLQDLMAQFMQVLLHPNEKEVAILLIPFTQVITLGTIYVATQLLGNWKRHFPQIDPAAAQKAGFLLRELGLTFALGSQMLESTFRCAVEGLDFREESQKKVIDSGMYYLLIILMLIDAQDNPKHGEFLETIQPFLEQRTESMNEAIRDIRDRNLLDEEQAALALNCIQRIQQAANEGDAEAMKTALAKSFEVLDISTQEIAQELKRVILLCSQLNESFRNIFYQADMKVSTVSQVA